MAQTRSTEEHVKTIRELLDLPPAEEEAFMVPASEPETEAAPGGGEPEEAEAESAEQEQAEQEQPEPMTQEPQPKPERQVDTKGLRSPSQRLFSRNIVRYPVIFIVSLSFFYLIFNFQAISAQIMSVVFRPPENQEAVLGTNLDQYNQWIKKYYYHVTDESILAANNDADGDGLTNLEEFYLKTNPLREDTDHDNFDDGREVLNGYNPLYAGLLTAAQQEVIAEQIDRETVLARKNFAVESQVAGRRSNLPLDSFAVDTSREGRVEIPKLNVSVPLVWNKNFEWVQDDLKHGAVHHLDTVYPGERGTSSVHGHSSGYIWDGDHKYAFTRINFLEPGDEVFVQTHGLDGSTRRYRYVVRRTQVYEPDDLGQFEGVGAYSLNISTSWPIGTARQRFVVHTELAGL